MSLTQSDLQEIREVVIDVVETKARQIVREEIKSEISPVRGELEALRNDIKEIYTMLSELTKKTITDDSFAKRTLEEKLLTLNTELLAAAKQAGITLPR